MSFNQIVGSTLALGMAYHMWQWPGFLFTLGLTLTNLRRD